MVWDGGSDSSLRETTLSDYKAFPQGLETMGFRTIIVLQQIIEFLSTLGGHFEPIPIPFDY